MTGYRQWDPHSARRGVRRVPGIAVRLLLAQTLVITAGAATAAIVAAIVGPPLFRVHLHRAGVPDASAEQFHAEQAYRYATGIAVGIALAVATLAALVVTWYFSRRLQRSIAEVSSAATAVADGHYDIRVSPSGLGDDFQTLARAFNLMAERLESVESTRRQLFGDLAHEIRTPVSVLEAYLEAVEDGVKTLDPDTIAMLREQTRRLVRFSDDFAALAKAEEGRVEAVPEWLTPGGLVSTAATAAADRYRVKGVTLTRRVAAGLPQLWADPQRLAQVLANLLDNALRHTPPNGHVEVAATAEGEELTITVSDTGDGIADEHLPRVFERFYRVDSARDRDHGGAGIGLAIAKAIIEAHGGNITAQSGGLGTGTTFTITMPVDR
ncbi:MAG: ATP-binding protein [Mycobacterium sp.]